MRSLIVTADDFGCSRAVNEAVIECYRRGIVRFTSLMVKGQAVQEAVQLARENPGLGIGLHLDLCRERPAYWGLRYFFDRRLARRLEGEIASQIERCLSLGITPTHADGHLNIQVHPVIFPVLARLAVRYRIPRIRLTGGELRLSLNYEPRSPFPRLILGGAFAALGAYLRREGEGRDLTIPDRTLGLLHSGKMTKDYLHWLIPRLPEGLSEIYFHPTTDPGAQSLHQTVCELELLTDPAVREALAKEGIRLVAAGEPLAA